jgi:hypothetical protein
MVELIEALNEAQAAEDERFQAPEQNDQQQQQQQGGGDSQPQPPIPPVAELKLLRGMQVQVLERTRRLDAARSAPAANREAIDAELRAIAAMQERLLEAAVEVVKKIEAPPGAPPNVQPDGAAETPEARR